MGDALGRINGAMVMTAIASAPVGLIAGGYIHSTGKSPVYNWGGPYLGTVAMLALGLALGLLLTFLGNLVNPNRNSNNVLGGVLFVGSVAGVIGYCIGAFASDFFSFGHLGFLAILAIGVCVWIQCFGY